MGLGNCTAASLRSHLSYGLEVLKAQRRGRPLSPFPVCLCLWRGRNEASYAVKGPHRSLPLSSASSPYTLLVFLGFVIRMRYTFLRGLCFHFLGRTPGMELLAHMVPLLCLASEDQPDCFSGWLRHLPAPGCQVFQFLHSPQREVWWLPYRYQFSSLGNTRVARRVHTGSSYSFTTLLPG